MLLPLEPMPSIDVTLITQDKYVAPAETNWYVENILLEDRLLADALQARGLKVFRTNWDNDRFDWRSTRFAFFRATWDYFIRFREFSAWLNRVSTMTRLVNPESIIRWNLDKHYLRDLLKKGFRIPPTFFCETDEERPLKELVKACGWNELILKPAVSGAARHTYRFHASDMAQVAPVFKELIPMQSILLQEFQPAILTHGEAAFMVFGGKYSHAVLKKAKAGDFRVQDDFGGSVHDYTPGEKEIRFAEDVVASISPLPVYARVDVIRDAEDRLCINELELIEPELWFRKYAPAAGLAADALVKYIQETGSS